MLGEPGVDGGDADNGVYDDNDDVREGTEELALDGDAKAVSTCVILSASCRY